MWSHSYLIRQAGSSKMNFFLPTEFRVVVLVFKKTTLVFKSPSQEDLKLMEESLEFAYSTLHQDTHTHTPQNIDLLKQLYFECPWVFRARISS